MRVRGPSWSPVGEVPATASSRRSRRGRTAPFDHVLGGPATKHVSVRPAGYSPGLVHLRLADDSIVPPLDDIKAWIDAIGDESGIDTIRTSALFPRSADRFAEAGFIVADTLSLLRADLGTTVVRAAIEHGPKGGGDATITLRRRDYAQAARVDRSAFGPAWGHDAGELDEIRHATPLHRARGRIQRSGLFRRDVEAFAVAGASSEHGYLQRLSVDPARQRRGHGRSLTTDALRWMTRRSLPDCLVNTSVNNVAALALYDSVGFRPMRDRLRVLQYDVRQST